MKKIKDENKLFNNDIEMSWEEKEIVKIKKFKVFSIISIDEYWRYKWLKEMENRNVVGLFKLFESIQMDKIKRINNN
jgi:hypothetical protein